MKWKEAMALPLKFVLFVNAEYEVERMATTISPPRLIRYACYYICVLPFVDVEVEEHNNHVDCSEDNYNMNLGT
jgi:hypothetical protein